MIGAIGGGGSSAMLLYWRRKLDISRAGMISQGQGTATAIGPSGLQITELQPVSQRKMGLGTIFDRLA